MGLYLQFYSMKKLIILMMIVAAIQCQSHTIQDFEFHNTITSTFSECSSYPVYTPNFLTYDIYACLPYYSSTADYFKVKQPSMSQASNITTRSSSYYEQKISFNQDATKIGLLMKSGIYIYHYLFEERNGALSNFKTFSNYRSDISDNMEYIVEAYHTSSIIRVYKWELQNMTIIHNITLPSTSKYFIRFSQSFISNDASIISALAGYTVSDANLFLVYQFDKQSKTYQQKFSKEIPSDDSTYLISDQKLIGTNKMLVGGIGKPTSSLGQFRLELINFETGEEKQLFVANCSFGTHQNQQGHIAFTSKGDFAAMWFFYSSTYTYFGIVHISNKGHVTNLTHNSQGQLFIQVNGSISKALIQFYEEEHHIYFKVFDEIYKHSRFVTAYPCGTGLEWNLASQTCQSIDCTTKKNVDSSSAETCGCLTGFLWDETSKECLRDCSNDGASTKTSLADLECECIFNHYWDQTNLRCQPHCNIELATGVNSTDPLRCQCRGNTVWDINTRNCVLKCQNIILSTGQSESPQICQCIAPSFWNSNILSCDLPCADISRASENSLNVSICTCSATHVWNSEKLTCSRNCLLDTNSNGTRLSDEVCFCNSGYIWDMNLQKCITFNCDMIKFSTGVQLDGDTCECKTNFQWDPILRACLVQCDQIVDNPLAGTSTTDLANVYQCPCQDIASWEIQSQKCVINCKLFDHTTGNRNITSCNCKMGFSWQLSSNIAESFCKTNCGSRPGELDSYNTSQGRCDCTSSFYWNFFYSACYRDCSSILNAVDMIISSPDQCICRTNSQWNNTSGKCDLTCTNAFDNGVSTSDSTKCDCSTNTVWFSYHLKCLPICQNDVLSDGSFDSATNQCRCTYDAEWDSTNNKCACVQGFQLNEVYQRCEQQTNTAAISAGVVGGTALIGSLTFAGFKIFKKKQKKGEEEDKEREKDNEKVVEIGSGAGIKTEEAMQMEQSNK